MGKNGKFSRSSGAGRSQQQGGKGDKPTHFLCFPIASAETVPVISESIKQWMDATTRPVRKAPHRMAVSEEASVSVDPDTPRAVKDEVTPNVQRPTTETFAETLKILPPVVTRAAGTWHLTLGVMNLGEDSRMQKALEVLHGLDLQGSLRNAESGPPAGHKLARRWRDDEKGEAAASVNIDEGEQAGSDRVRGKHLDDQGQQPLQPITIALTGLGGFPSLKKARVLWARPREQVNSSGSTESADRPVLGSSERLYNFALHLIQPFRDAGLITETRALALHATVSNMRFAKNRGRTSSWKSDKVDARRIGRVWNDFDGDTSAATDVEVETEDDMNESEEETAGRSEQQNSDDEDAEESEEGDIRNSKTEFVWLKDIEVNRVAICKLGATKHEDPIWREWYPAIENGERLVFE